MNDLYTAGIFTTNDALYWVGDAFVFQSYETITNHPWAKTVKLVGPDKHAFLKILPAAAGQSANAPALLSKSFPTQVPKLLKSDENAGYFLYQDHAAQTLDKKPDTATKQAILSQYAIMQITALHDKDIAKSLPQIRCAEQYDKLLEFLSNDPDPKSENTLNAMYFLRPGTAERYHQIFLAAADMFKPFLSRGDALAPTLNHCDLRPGNIARRADGSLIIYDWDDAVFGPAGLSLPAMFSGAKRSYKALNDFKYIANNKEKQQDLQLLETYITKLAASKTYPHDQLVKCLPAVICAGAIQYITSFAKYPVESRRLRETIAKNLQRRLSDLMDLAHYLALETPDKLPLLVEAFNTNDRKTRANRLTERHKRYLGGSAAKPAKKPSRSSLIAQSDAPDVFPSVDITPDEQRSGAIADDTRDLSVALFKRHGALMLKNVMPLELINTCNNEFHALYNDYLQAKKPGGTLRVGDKRFMVTLEFAGAFARPALFASPILMPILNALLGKDAILGSLTAVASLPGSSDQRMHKDNTVLFKEEPDMMTPSVSIALIVPLIALNRETGATRIVKGSHRNKPSSKQKLPYQDPIVDLGSCYLMDSRLSHRGMANNSTMIRPIISLVYQRPWYRDHINFKKQKPLDIKPSQLNDVPENLQHLVNWAVE